MIEPLATGAAPVYLVTEYTSESNHIQRGPCDGWKLHSLLMKLAGTQDQLNCRKMLGAVCRGVGVDRLPIILDHGCDVLPTDSPIYVSDIVKAAEYGGEIMAMQFFDPARLQRTYKEVPVTVSETELRELAAIYPTRISMGDRFWLTKLKSTDRRAGSSYEVEFARWIPGDPLQALRMLWIIGPVNCISRSDLIKTNWVCS